MGLYSNEVTLPLINTEIAMALFSHLPYSLNNNSNIFYKYLFPKIYKNLQRCSRVQVPLFVCCFLPEENNTALKIELKLFPAITLIYLNVAVPQTQENQPLECCTFAFFFFFLFCYLAATFTALLLHMFVNHKLTLDFLNAAVKIVKDAHIFTNGPIKLIKPA